MHTYDNISRSNKVEPAANTVTNNNSSTSPTQFIDNRPEAIAQRVMQEKINAYQQSKRDKTLNTTPTKQVPHVVQRITEKELQALERLNGGGIRITVEDSENRAEVEQRLQNMVDSNSPKGSRANINRCIQYMLSHEQDSGGGTGITHAGQQVFHISHGQRDADDGVTLFFIHLPGDQMENRNEPTKIIGIGHHTNESSASYKLDWGIGTAPWIAGSSIRL